MKTKLPKPQRLPSGVWRCQVMVDGKRVSVTDEDKNVAQAKAVAMKNGLIDEKKNPESITVGDAIDKYIENKDSVLSPSTIRGYKRIRQHDLQKIMNVKLKDLSQEKIQKAVNTMSKGSSPKSVRNAHGLLSAALAEYLPDMVLNTTLPQKERYEASVPSDEDIEKIISAACGTKIELPILLAIWLGLRASEIRGITWDCISNGTLHIKQAIVDGESGPEKKGTKTFSGNRKIKLPQYIIELIEKQPKVDEYVVHLSGQAMYKRFSRLCEKEGIPHYRFHDLRHPYVKPTTKKFITFFEAFRAAI